MAEISNLRKQYLSEIGHSVDAALEPVENYDGLKGVPTNARDKILPFRHNTKRRVEN